PLPPCRGALPRRGTAPDPAARRAGAPGALLGPRRHRGGALTAPLLEVADLRKTSTARRGFPRTETVHVKALAGISFRIAEGEAFGLVGESGCGKSTAGRALLRLIEPDGGAVLYRGEDFLTTPGGRLRQLRQKLQIVF